MPDENGGEKKAHYGSCSQSREGSCCRSEWQQIKTTFWCVVHAIHAASGSPNKAARKFRYVLTFFSLSHADLNVKQKTKNSVLRNETTSLGFSRDSQVSFVVITEQTGNLTTGCIFGIYGSGFLSYFSFKYFFKRILKIFQHKNGNRSF